MLAYAYLKITCVAKYFAPLANFKPVIEILSTEVSRYFYANNFCRDDSIVRAAFSSNTCKSD